jgi:hypothetical protein
MGGGDFISIPPRGRRVPPFREFMRGMSGLFIPLCFQSQEAERGTSHAPGVASVKQWCQAEAEYLSECIYMQAAASVAEVESVEYRSEIATALERNALK